MQAVTVKLNREYEGLVRFETVLWEEHLYTADKSFQPQIPDAVASDIVVSIFWTLICRSTRLTLTRLRCRSANSKHFCERSRSELFVVYAGGLARSCQPSVAQNAALQTCRLCTHMTGICFSKCEAYNRVYEQSYGSS